MADFLDTISQGLTALGSGRSFADVQAQQEERARLGQVRDLTQQAAQGGLGSQAFKSLVGLDANSANKLKGLLQTDEQGLDAAFQDAAVFQNLLQNDPTGQSALQFGTQRLQAGAGSGRNMAHTQRFLQEVQQDPQAALQSIGSFLEIPSQLAGQRQKSVQSAKILDDGTIIEVLKGGGRQVISASGETLTGEAAKEAVSLSRDQAFNRKKELARLSQTIKREERKEGLFSDQQLAIQRGNIKRLGTLSGTSSGRASSVKKATKFKLALERGEAASGAGRKGASFIPGVFTSQGQFDEEFNAFAEVAARQQLKASGETRPTDADVQGMKQAMFGIGRDETVNIQLLSDFINDQNAQNTELDQLINASRGGTLSEFTFTPAPQNIKVDIGSLSDEDLFN